MSDLYIDIYVFTEANQLLIYKFENNKWNVERKPKQNINVLNEIFIFDKNEFKFENDLFIMKQEYLNKYEVKNVEINFYNGFNSG